MRKIRTDITSQGFYSKKSQILRSFQPEEVVTEEEINEYQILEHLLEPLTEEEKKALEEIKKKEREKLAIIRKKQEYEKTLEWLNSQPHLGRIEFPKEKRNKKKQG